MNFERFTIIKKQDFQEAGETRELILLNIDHIVSIKPIKIVLEEVLDGYWIRMTNGKKYRATEIPSQVSSLIFH